MTTPAPTKIEYYQGYDDPTADMVLVLKGGVKFRVHSYLLKAHSEFFRNMPDHDGKLCGTSVKEISFDASPAEFALLLDLIDNRHITTSPDWQDLGNVLQLGETFHFIHLYLLVARQARQSPPKGNPWAAFVLSANNGYAEVAQRALADFSKTHLWASTSEEVTPDQLADLTGRAATALICAMRRAVVSPRKVYYPETKENVYKSMTDWQGVVKDFEYGCLKSRDAKTPQIWGK